MKTNLILLLALGFVLFTGCSSEETFIDEVEETTILNKKGEQTNSNTSSKTLDWFDDDDDGGTSGYEIPSDNYYVLVQYPGDYSAAKIETTRNNHAPNVGLISFYNCNSSHGYREVWEIDIDLWNSYCCLNISYGQPEVATSGDDDDVSVDDFLSQICAGEIVNPATN